MANRYDNLPEQFHCSKEEMEAFRKRVVQYKTSMCIIKEMYQKEIIDRAEYVKSEKEIAAKFDLSDKSIFRCYDPDDSMCIGEITSETEE